MTTTTDTPLSITRTFNASPERIFAAWTDPQLLVQWWGPPGSQIQTAEIDLREGGRYHIRLRNDDQHNYALHGVYQTIEPPRKLAFTWRWEDPKMDIGESLVTIELRPQGQQTELHLTHAKLPNQAAREHHQRGWVGILEGLADFFSLIADVT